MALRCEPTDLADLIRQTVELYEDLAEERGVDDRTSTRRAMLVGARAIATGMRQVLANLLDNAVKYTPRRRPRRDRRARGRTRRRADGRRHRASASPPTSCRASGTGSTAATRAARRAGSGSGSAWSRRSSRRTAGRSTARVRRLGRGQRVRAFELPRHAGFGSRSAARQPFTDVMLRAMGR